MIFILFLISFVLLSNGCSKEQRGIKVPEIYKGTDGLKMEFMDDAPPKEAYEGQYILLGLDIQNQGPVDIRKGVISLGLEHEFLEVDSWDNQGHDMDLYNVNSFTSTFDIDGKTIEFPEAKRGIAVVKLHTSNLEGQHETHTSLIRASVCYPYKTILNEEVCIDSDLFQTKQGVKVCESKDISLNSQGGPIAITQIEPTMMPNSDGTKITPYFKIKIQNKGNGLVTSTDSLKACSSESIDRQDLNKITVNAKLFDKKLDCTPSLITLKKNKEAEFTCQLNNGININQDAFKSILVINLEYGYTYTISKEIEIMKQS